MPRWTPPYKLYVDANCNCKTPSDLIQLILNLRMNSYNNDDFGPFEVYVCSELDAMLDSDWNPDNVAEPEITVRQRIMRIEGIAGIFRLKAR